MKPSQVERRRHRRHGVDGLRVNLPVRGRVLNASVDGIAIETTRSLRLGSSHAFRLGEGRRTIRIPGRIAWCRPVGTRRTEDGSTLPLFELGIELAGSIWSRAQTHIYP